MGPAAPRTTARPSQLGTELLALLMLLVSAGGAFFVSAPFGAHWRKCASHRREAGFVVALEARPRASARELEAMCWRGYGWQPFTPPSTEAALGMAAGPVVAGALIGWWFGSSQLDRRAASNRALVREELADMLRRAEPTAEEIATACRWYYAF